MLGVVLSPISFSLLPQVPNIRFNVAKELRSVAGVSGAYETVVLPILTLLLEDDDRDVRFYAEQTMNALEEEMATPSTTK
jgi:hypothetical protein